MSNGTYFRQVCVSRGFHGQIGNSFKRLAPDAASVLSKVDKASEYHQKVAT